jgi:hypothetical protein
MNGKLTNTGSNTMAKFGGKALGRAAGKAGGAVVRNINPLDVLREYCECRKAADREQTRREEIRAKRDVAVAAIQAQKDLIEDYFRRRFSERAEVLDSFCCGNRKSSRIRFPWP